MSAEDETREIMKIVNENSEYYRLATYIMNKHDDFAEWFTLEEAKRIAKYLVLEMGYKKEDILNGNADSELDRQYFLKLIKRNSIVTEDELEPETPLKTIKKFLEQKEIRRIIQIALALTMTAVITTTLRTSLEEQKVTHKVDESIAMLSSPYGSSDYIHRVNIANQNKYMVSFDSEKNETVVAYHYDMLAKDIIDVCKKDADLFDVVIYNTYFNLEYERLKSMDEIWNYLKLYFSKDEAFAPLYESIKDCDVFLDYVVKKLNVPDEQILTDITRYKQVLNYYNLKEDEQQRISSLIEKYEESKMALYGTYQDRLNELALETESSGGR